MSDILEAHGTKAFQLKPSSIVHAAKADLALKERKQSDKELRCQHYAFHRKHVAKASTAKELLALAVKESEIGGASAKKNTRLIYSDRALLEAALQISEAA